ncbi:unnamed protein product [Diatraea saccharalis]|uniref:EGF-like domain-containing protein n=1 Tax=Diatraea saccharalis TaxID=40085 RepID=A0A9N9WHG2_9NEOP|nr:unnamed protein product [Diatraea saccharalis]
MIWPAFDRSLLYQGICHVSGASVWCECTAEWTGERCQRRACVDADCTQQHDNTPPARDNIPSAHNNTPPAHDHTPPAHDHTPPAHDHTPPAHDHTPPAHDNQSHKHTEVSDNRSKNLGGDDHDYLPHREYYFIIISDPTLLLYSTFSKSLKCFLYSFINNLPTNDVMHSYWCFV